MIDCFSFILKKYIKKTLLKVIIKSNIKKINLK